MKGAAYWRYNPDNTRTFVEIDNDRDLKYHHDLQTKGYIYEELD